jgi:hypothetical protein
VSSAPSPEAKQTTHFRFTQFLELMEIYNHDTYMPQMALRLGTGATSTSPFPSPSPCYGRNVIKLRIRVRKQKLEVDFVLVVSLEVTAHRIHGLFLLLGGPKLTFRLERCEKEWTLLLVCGEFHLRAPAQPLCPTCTSSVILSHVVI